MNYLEQIAPIAILLTVVVFAIKRLPTIDVGHSQSFLRRRVLNWAPLGLTYAFLYMGRYNLKVSKFAFESMQGPSGNTLMGNDAFGLIFGIGTVVYGCSFLINGPLTDKYGGRRSILIGAAGAAVANFAMGLASWSLMTNGLFHAEIGENFVPIFATMYSINMYFQSFGAVAIVKVNASWFHLRERGVFGAIFGVLISLGIYFAFDWGYAILGDDHSGLALVFFVPSAALSLFFVADYFWVRDTPGQAGERDFDTGDATLSDDEQLGAIAVFSLMLKNPIIMTIAFIEFCSGFLRQAIMQWYRTFAKQTDTILGLQDSFVYENWGLLLCCAGIMGGVIAGVLSDHLFQSRRGPVAALLYGVLSVCAIGLYFGYTTVMVGPLVIIMSMAVIGVHGMLSGTASMDFGGRKNVGVAVGIIDGFVYLGTGIMSFTYAIILPHEQLDAAGNIVGPATNPDNWSGWPLAMIPIALIGLALTTRVWNAKPRTVKKA